MAPGTLYVKELHFIRWKALIVNLFYTFSFHICKIRSSDKMVPKLPPVWKLLILQRPDIFIK